MSEKPTNPDPVELTRRVLEPANRRDLAATASFYAPDAVWDMSPMGLGTYEGLAAIRGFFDDWIEAYEEFEIGPEEILDLGNGVVFAVVRQNGRLVGSTSYVQWRYATVVVWVEGMITWNANYPDIDEARAAAERLAEERG